MVTTKPMKKKDPIRRVESLQPLSREHHESLLLCWKIRKGFSKGISAVRIKRYADWFYKYHISQHFQEEECYLFPILGAGHDHVKKAVSDHRKLSRLFAEEIEIEKSLSLIEEGLDNHIRFEERVLFNEIQEKATHEQLDLIAIHHSPHPFTENTEDEFWK